MTNQLKDLMTEAVDAQAPYVPDLDTLVRTGRRQVRRRRTVGVVATVAAVAVVAGATTVAFDTINRAEDAPVAPMLTPRSPTVLPAPSVGPGGSTGTCSTADGKGAQGWQWPVVLYVQDTFGMSIIRKSPAGVIAYCTTEWGNGATLSVIPGKASDQIVLRKSAAVGRGAQPGSSVTTVFGFVPRGIPVRITVETADGHVGVAAVKDGQFAYRRVEHSPWPGPVPHAIVRIKTPGKSEWVLASR